MGGADILVVDDDVINRRMMSAVINSMGHQSRTAANGLDALESVRDNLPDLILLDLQMPVMDGFEFLATRQGDKALSTVPVIIVSAQNDAESAVFCMQNGASDYILKPSNPTTVKHRVNLWIDHLRIRRQANRLGSYLIEQRLGSGGSGDVYLARHTLLRRKTAVKRLRQDRIKPKMMAMFENEVRITCELTHPNTIAVYDYGHAPDGTFYYAMEYVDGIDLLTLIRLLPFGLPPGRIIFLLQQVCGSLSEAHKRGLVHRDLKAANVMIGERGGLFDFVKVLDFGIAVDSAELRNGTCHSTAGTPLYMSPEQIAMPSAVDQRTDVYALGVLAYYLVCGEHVFDGKTSEDIMNAHLTRKPVPPSQRRPELELSTELDDLILSCLAKEAEDRPATVTEVSERLAACPSAGTWTSSTAAAWWEHHDHEIQEHRPKPAPIAPQLVTIDVSPRTGPKIIPQPP